MDARLSPHCDRAAGFFDFFPGGRADFIGFDRQAVLQFAVAKNLDSNDMTADQLRFAQQLLVNTRARLERIEIVKIHDRIILVKGGVVESAFRQSPNQRHLPAFEPEPNAAAGARLLSFVTFAARFSVTGAFTATKAL